jgi:phosphoglucosamine mutase
MKRQFFGTDGVRGPYGGPVINENFAERIGVAAGRFVSRTKSDGSLRVILGRDTRASGKSLLNAVASGLASLGLQCETLDVVPTPAVAAAVAREKAALGVVITASHNPASDNGIKFFGPNGMKLSDEQEAAIEALIPTETPTLTGPVTLSADGVPAYLEAAKKLLPENGLLGWKIVLDTANGATFRTSPMVLRSFGAELLQIGAEPNGTNINLDVGSEHPDKLAQRVRESGARLGIAHDGDGDRCVFCDEKGDVLDGDEVMTLLAIDALQRSSLAKNLLVVTVQSNLGVDTAVARAGGRVLRANVGDRYVIERMQAEGAKFGGESSGHFVCADVSPTGDGLVAALKVLEVMIRTGKPLSELKKALTKFPQITRNLRVKEKKPVETLPHLPIAIQQVERDLGDKGRVLVRFSGTEPKLRLLVEAATNEIAEAAIARLETVARADLEVV